MNDTDIFVIIKQYRVHLLSGEKDAADRLTSGYGVAWRKIKTLLDAVTQQIGQRQAAGAEVSPSWLYRQQRYQALLDQAHSAIDAWSKVAAGQITAQQAQAVILGASHAQKATAAQMNAAGVGHSWNNVPHSALQHLIGAMGDGSPLADRFAQLAPTGVDAIKDALVEGVSIGKGPRQIAIDVRNAAAVPLDQALVVSRSEVLRASREAARESMLQNSDTVQCYVRLCSFSARTCAACLALNGKEYPLDEPMDTHPCCRCVMVAKIFGSDKAYQSGEDWLRKQPEATQAAILGKKAAAAWRDGAVSLGDFVEVRHSEKWGDSVQVRSLKGALNAAETSKAQPVLRMENDLVTLLANTAAEEQRQTLSEIITDERSKKPFMTHSGGMADRENLFRWQHSGVSFSFEESGPDSPVVASVLALAQVKAAPERLLNETRRIVFTKQPNKDDSYWAAQYGDPDFISAATGGGNNSIHVYNGQPIRPDELVHEMAHNLATALYGPRKVGPDFQAAIDSGEPVPTAYALNGVWEDFADSVKEWFFHPAEMQQKSPQRYNIIERLMTDDGYHG